MSTAASEASGRGDFVPREVCERIHADQQEANRLTHDELRSLRKLVIALVVGGQLFTGGLNFAGFGYWLRQHEATPHPATVEMIATARAEGRDDARDLRREIQELRISLVERRDSVRAPAGRAQGGAE